MGVFLLADDTLTLIIPALPDRPTMAVRVSGQTARREATMYAVIKTGGKQYRVQEGDTIRVEKLDGDVGGQVEFDEILMVGGESPKVGTPTVGGAKVVAKITAQDRAKKVIVFKMKRRKNYRRKRGHRQPFTELRIQSVSA